MTKVKDTDPDGMNDQRAEWAGSAVKDYARTACISKEDDETRLHDLLCNLHHWADRKGIILDEVLTRARAAYAEEIGEDMSDETVRGIARG